MASVQARLTWHATASARRLRPDRVICFDFFITTQPQAWQTLRRTSLAYYVATFTTTEQVVSREVPFSSSDKLVLASSDASRIPSRTYSNARNAPEDSLEHVTESQITGAYYHSTAEKQQSHVLLLGRVVGVQAGPLPFRRSLTQASNMLTFPLL